MGTASTAACGLAKAIAKPQAAEGTFMPQLRLGVIGVGHLGKEHARILSGMADVDLVGIVDAHGPQAELIAQRCNTWPFTDHRALLPLVDAAVIVTPTS